ncbi:MAG: alpha/beta hydrolase [Rikenellaceae bacterium]|nr:alpha/beta hydrolase [Rikenellaceae bacterium]
MVRNMSYEDIFMEALGNRSLDLPIESNVDHRKIEHTGSTIHYFTSGNPQNQTVVFIHPAYGDHHCFDRQTDYFSSEYHVIMLDLPGHGLSQVGLRGAKIDSSATIIDLILRAENKSQVHIVGVSIGALIGQHFAMLYPDKTLSLTALGGYDIQTEQTEIARCQRREIFGATMRMIFSMDAFRRHVANASCADNTERLCFYRSAKSFTRKSLSAMTGFGNIVRPREKTTRNHPLLILVGEHDVDLARRAAENWHDSEPGSQFAVVLGAGHCANMDNSQLFNEMTLEFLRKTGSGNGEGKIGCAQP